MVVAAGIKAAVSGVETTMAASIASPMVRDSAVRYSMMGGMASRGMV